MFYHVKKATDIFQSHIGKSLFLTWLIQPQQKNKNNKKWVFDLTC